MLPERPLAGENGRRTNGAAVALAVFAAGVVIGLGLAADLGGEFVAGLIILAGLCFTLALLSRVAENTRRRITAGELLLEPIRLAYLENLPARGFHPEPEFKIAELVNDAGVVGAADLARLHASSL